MKTKKKMRRIESSSVQQPFKDVIQDALKNATKRERGRKRALINWHCTVSEEVPVNGVRAKVGTQVG